MHWKTLFGLLATGLTVFVSSSIGLSIAPPSQGSIDLSDQFPDGEGKVYVQTLCRTCHGLENIVSQRKTPEGWEATVYDMLGRISSGMDREAKIISKYLAENFNSQMMTARTGDPTPDVAASPKAGSSRIRIFHQVLFRFKPEVTGEQKKVLLESGKKMLESVPEVATLVVGKIAQESSEFSYGLVTGFETEEALQAYRSHPEHQKWLEEIYRPLILKSLVTDVVATE